MPDLFDTFLAAPFRARLGMVQNPANQDSLRGVLGEQAFDEYLKLGRVIDEEHLSQGPVPNLVFVPGVMGSLLSSRGLGGVWWIDMRSRGHINDLRLTPDGLSDADPRADVAPFEVDMRYEGFFAATFATREFRHVSFPYDWRKSLLASTAQLRETVVRVSEKSGGQPVHLVAHSMGGLMVRATLMRHPELWPRIGRIVFIGTPHYGSPAIAGYLKNHLWGFDLLALLGRYLDRRTFRSLWGVISLLPAPYGTYPSTRAGVQAGEGSGAHTDHPCANFDLYDAGSWHLGLDPDETGQLQSALDAAATFYRDLLDWHTSLDQEMRDRMAVIAGVGYKTLFRVAYKKAFGFLWEHMDRVTARQPGNVHREGDGRVPLASAELEWVGEARYVHAEHGRLPTVPEVYQDVFRFLSGKEMRLPNSPEGALGKHLASQRFDTITPALAGSVPVISSDDPGYLSFAPVDESVLMTLEEALSKEALPNFARVRLM